MQFIGGHHSAPTGRVGPLRGHQGGGEAAARAGGGGEAAVRVAAKPPPYKIDEKKKREMFRSKNPLGGW